MKVALCCIGRMENRYAAEFVEHYKSIGVDKIFIYDNNYGGEEHFEDVLSDHINDGFIDIIDFRGKSCCQLEAYQNCYNVYGKEYDWILFVDLDEYLYMNGFDNIKVFLSQDRFKEYDLIHINLMDYGDSGLVKYDNRRLMDRFTKPILPLDFKKAHNFSENDHIKSIVRGGLDSVQWNATPHTPSNSLRCCDAGGNKQQSTSPFIHPFNFTYAHFKHYITKTIQEWCEIKTKRGYPDGNKDYFKKHDIVDEFFKWNEKTKEKMEYIKSLNREEPKKNDVNIFICTHKDFDSPVSSDVYKVVDSRKIEKTGILDDKFYSELFSFKFVLENIDLPKYVGFCHYRRYFSFMDDVPNMDEIFSEFDGIVTKPIKLKSKPDVQYRKCHNIDDLRIMEDIIYDKYNDYYGAYKTWVDGNYLIPYNMFIMRREDFIEYMKFVFGVLDEYVKIVGTDISKRIEENKDKYLKKFSPNDSTEYQYRIGGYLAERLTNVFIFKHFKKMKSFEVNITEKKYGTYNE